MAEWGLIEIENLYKNFDELKVLDGISFSVGEGEFVTIFGPSGCGKTTLLRILGTLTPPTAGRITVRGIDAFAQQDEYKDKISMVWQDPRLLPWRTALENVSLALELRYPKMCKGEIRDRGEDSLAFVGLADFKKRLPRELSGGMRQRINLARALVLDAEIMYMDEPLASLNEVTDKRLLMNEISKLWEVKKKTVVYVTHSVNEAIFLSERIVVLSEKPTHILDHVRIPLSRPRDLSSREVTETAKKINSLFTGLFG